ncbi:uncharacterized protein VTP21DRAFT_782 [Calcarisporiella thermophila]|uniref:uncharacterized protein n=1 Tax=Calcarisporiella thermophila TaxID=911321 RepID=UPI003744A030
MDDITNLLPRQTGNDNSTPSHSPGDAVPGSPTYNAHRQGPIYTQLAISSVVGLSSFLIFCFLRTKWPSMFAPRLNMRNHAPKPLPSTFFGWVWPLIKISESTVLEKVGLDAVVLLSFYKMAFYLFAMCCFFGVFVLIPLTIVGSGKSAIDEMSITNIPDGSPYLVAYLFFTYIFSFTTFYLILRNYKHVIKLRRKHLIRHAKTIPARTVMVTGIPLVLRSDRALAEYFEGLGAGNVESAHVCRKVNTLKKHVEKRAKYLRALEWAYTKMLGNPCELPDYNPESILLYERLAAEHSTPIQDGLMVSQLVEKGDRPTIRDGLWHIFGNKVDAINYYREKFLKYDQLVEGGRQEDNYETTSVGFVTFEKMSSAMIVAQTLNNPKPFTCRTSLAPEPRDIYWPNVNIQGREILLRWILVWVVVILIVLFYTLPLSAIATLTSPDTLDKYIPGFKKLAELNFILQSIIMGFIPTIGVVIFFAILPLMFDGLSVIQGIRSRSKIEESTFSKLFIFYIFNLFLVFTISSLSWKALQDILKDTTQIPQILAKKLPLVSVFFINYTILQGIALYPLQLLQVGLMILSGFTRLFLCSTPRDYAESYTPPLVNYGWIYPQSLFIFIIVLTYSTISPLILLFGMVYFGIGFIVHKYQLLYLFFHPYESGGTIWPRLFNRIIVGLVIFQLTMLGLFLLKRSFALSGALIPVIFLTFIYQYYVIKGFRVNMYFLPLELVRTYEDLSVEEYNETLPSMSIGGSLDKKMSEVIKSIKGKMLKSSSIVSSPGSYRARKKKVAKKRRHILDEDEYEATPLRKTNFSQPCMSLNYGVLNTGMRRYAEPALTGILPTLWLPEKATKDEYSPISGSVNAGSSLVGGPRMAKLVVPLRIEGEGEVDGSMNGIRDEQTGNALDRGHPDQVEVITTNCGVDAEEEEGEEVIVEELEEDYSDEEDEERQQRDQSEGSFLGSGSWDRERSLSRKTSGSTPSTSYQSQRTYFHHPDRRRSRHLGSSRSNTNP